MDQYPLKEIKSQLLLSDFIVVNSNSEKLILSEILDIEKNKFRVVKNGFDSSLLGLRLKSFPLIEEIPVDWKGKYILCMANIEKRKNLHILIKAANKLEINLVIAGNIRDRDYYESLKINNFKNVLFTGPVKQNSKKYYSLFRNASCFVLPSTLETPGLAALEAAALNIPLVVTHEGYSKEYFGGIETYYDGFKANLNELCEIIKYALEKPEKAIVDFDLIKELTWDNVVLNQIEVYKDLI